MNVRIELCEEGEEDQIIIHCKQIDETVLRIQQCVLDQTAAQTKYVFYKGQSEFYFPIDAILFFETEGDHLYAHTTDDAFRMKYRLYELEELLPRWFTRASKSTIINGKKVHSITKNLTAGVVAFFDSHKHIYVSRHYYQQVRNSIRKESI